MKYLMNLSTHPEDVGKFGQAPGALTGFLKEFQLDGVEAINYEQWDETILPAACVEGYHMPFWPLWLPFWQEDQNWVTRTFGDVETASLYYGGETKLSLVNSFKNHLKTALEMGAQYAVFHVSHCELEECFSYDFKTDSKVIVEAFIELLNLALTGMNLPNDFALLFENQWWPGLDFLQRDLMERLLGEVKHANLGFMLDTGHFMNAHRGIRTEAEALESLHEWYENLGNLKPHIKGIHLSSSLSGSYVEQIGNDFRRGALQGHPALQTQNPFFERYFASFSHIGEIDQHRVFENPEISILIEKIKPDWLVLEFMTATKKEAAQKIGRQLSVIESLK